MGVREDNRIIFEKLSVYLNLSPRRITPQQIAVFCELDISVEEAFRAIMSALLGLDCENEDEDYRLYRSYFPYMFYHLDPQEYRRDPYLTTIRLPEEVCGAWELRQEEYTPFEAFVFDDPLVMADGRVIPQIGFFDERFPFPAVLEQGREWMTITPNEINTMRTPIAAARGSVLTFGLGLGYYAFMAARKPEVTHVTVVEKSAEVIRLYRTYIEPQNPYADKITILEDDAFAFAEERMAAGSYDTVFVDIWHDPSDGVAAYKRFKSLEARLPTADYHYWIEKTLRLYM